MSKYGLLLDSSDINLAIGIVKDEELIYSYNEYAWQRQSEYMIPKIQEALKQLNLSLKDIDYIALGIGPGSYTGVRIPLAIAKTLYAVRNIKIIPLSSLKIMGTNKESYIALMNARSMRSYIGIYDKGTVVMKDQVIKNSELKDIIEKYSKEGFIVKGDTGYLNMNLGDTSFDVLKGLVSYASISGYVSNVDSLCPIYLKD